MTTSNKTAILPPIKVQNVDQQLRGLVSTTVEWFATHWLQIIIAVGVASLLVVFFHFLRRLARKYCADRTGPGNWMAVLARTAEKTGNVFMVMAAARLVEGGNFAGTPAQVASTINFLWTLSAWFQVAIWAREIILGSIENRTHSEHYSGEALNSAMGIIRMLVTFAVFAVAFIVVLDNIGVNVTGLIAGLGVGGIAIGLAAQGIFADLFAALAIIFDRPFHRGDAISYDRSSGTVEAIGLKSTRIRGVTGEERIVANRNLLNKEIINNTRREYRRVVFTLGLVQQVPVGIMECLPSMLKEVIEGHGAKFVRAGFTGFSATGYDFSVEFDSPGPAFQDFFDLRHMIGLDIIRALEEAGAALAYPPMTAVGATAVDQHVGTAPPLAAAGERGTGATPSTSAVDGDTGAT